MKTGDQPFSCILDRYVEALLASTCMLHLRSQVPWPTRLGSCYHWTPVSQTTRSSRSSHGLRVQSRSSGSVKAQTSAKESVEAGLKLFSDRKYKDALEYFQSALQSSPSDDEARAALYNSACAHAKLKQWQPATDAVRRAVNDYKLRLTVAVKVRACMHREDAALLVAISQGINHS